MPPIATDRHRSPRTTVGSRSGFGRLVCTDGGEYAGEWRVGWQEGKGTYVAPDGERYEGEWSAGERSGRGRCVYASRDVYEGQWRHGRRHGRGHMTYVSQPPPANPPGFTPRGPPSPLRMPPTREPKKEGGALLLKGWQEAPKAAAPMPPTYEGEWREDQRCGQGKAVSYGEVYEGGWLQGKRHGHGTCFYPDGEVYVGSWVFGKRQGDGALANWP